MQRQNSVYRDGSATTFSLPAELLGFETIGVEIENPFGRDFNDLPLDMVIFSFLLHFETDI